MAYALADENGMIYEGAPRTIAEEEIAPKVEQLFYWTQESVEEEIKKYPESLEDGGISATFLRNLFEQDSQTMRGLANINWKNLFQKSKEKRDQEPFGSFDESIAEYEKANQKGFKTITTVLHLPLLLQTNNYDVPEPIDNELETKAVDKESNFLSEIWTSAFVSKSQNPERWLPEDPQEIIDRINKVEDEDYDPRTTENKTKQRDVRFRVRAPVSAENCSVAWERGLRIGMGPAHFERFKEKKKKMPARYELDIYHLETKTLPVEMLIETFMRLYETSLWQPDEVAFEQQLIEESELEDGEFEKKTRESYRTHNNKKLFLMLRLLSNISRELTLDLNKRCTGQFTFVLKQIGNGLWTLSKPTIAGPMFYSILAHKKNFKTISPYCEMFYPLGQYMATNFVSTDFNRLSHLSYVDQRMMPLLDMWNTSFRVHPKSFINKISEERSRVLKHFCASLLIWLENRQCTSETLIPVRYMMMVATSQYEQQNSARAFSKVPKDIRSPVQLWIIQSVIKCLKTMNVVRPVIEANTNPSISGDRFYGLKSWVDQGSVRTFECLANLMYMGHLHNKESGDKNHANLSIFCKIIKYTMLRNKNKERTKDYGFSSKNHDEMETSQFSLGWLWCCGDEVRLKCHETLGYRDMGPDGEMWVKHLKKQFCKKVESHSAVELATFKSSADSDISTPFYPGQPKAKNGKRTKEEKTGFNKRSKAIHLMYKSLIKDPKRFNFSAYPLLDILDLLEYCGGSDRQKGIITELFKKQQIGGIREIFILLLESRIAVLWLETFSRILCDLLPYEMLTAGKTKFQKITSYFQDLARLARDNPTQKEMTMVSTSGDASNWCQRFVMTIFAVLLYRVLPKGVFMLCCRILNLCYYKKHALPIELIDLLLAQDVVSLTRPEMDYLKKVLLGDIVDPCLMDQAMMVFINDRGNFMQGIFHYTSSLVHTGHVLLIERFWKHEFDIFCMGTKEKPSINAALQPSFQISSDDWLALLAAVFGDAPNIDSETAKKLIEQLLEVFHLTIIDSYPLIGAMNSIDKTTPIVKKLGPMEFNQNFYIFNTIVLPYIKAILAIQPSATNTFLGRVQQAYELVHSICDFGGGMRLARMALMCSCVMHYRSLGLVHNKMLGKVVWDQLKVMKHPSLGFFPLAPALVSGLFPFGSTYWRTVRTNHTSFLIEMALRQSSLETYDQDAKKTHTLGIDHNSNRKFLENKKQFGDITAHKEVLRENHMSLINGGLNPALVASLIADKGFNPSAKQALVYQKPINAVIQSVYILTHACVTQRIKMAPEDIVVYLTGVLKEKKKAVTVENLEEEKKIYDAENKIDLEGLNEKRGVVNYSNRNSRIKKKSFVRILKETTAQMKRVQTYWESLSDQEKIDLKLKIEEDICPSYNFHLAMDEYRITYQPNHILRESQESPVVRVSLKVSTRKSDMPLSPLMIMRSTWGMSKYANSSKSALERSVSSIQKTLTWFMPTIKESLMHPDCPCEDYPEAINVVKSMKESTHSLQMNSRAGVKRLNTMEMDMVFAKDWMPGFTLKRFDKEAISQDSNKKIAKGLEERTWASFVTKLLYTPCVTTEAYYLQMKCALASGPFPDIRAELSTWTTYLSGVEPIFFNLIAIGVICLNLITLKSTRQPAENVRATNFSRTWNEEVMAFSKRQLYTRTLEILNLIFTEYKVGTIGYFTVEQVQNSHGHWVGNTRYVFFVHEFRGEVDVTSVGGRTAINVIRANDIKTLKFQLRNIKQHLIMIFGDILLPSESIIQVNDQYIDWANGSWQKSDGERRDGHPWSRVELIKNERNESLGSHFLDWLPEHMMIRFKSHKGHPIEKRIEMGGRVRAGRSPGEEYASIWAAYPFYDNCEKFKPDWLEHVGYKEMTTLKGRAVDISPLMADITHHWITSSSITHLKFFTQIFKQLKRVMSNPTVAGLKEGTLFLDVIRFHINSILKLGWPVLYRYFNAESDYKDVTTGDMEYAESEGSDENEDSLTSMMRAMTEFSTSNTIAPSYLCANSLVYRHALSISLTNLELNGLLPSLKTKPPNLSKSEANILANLLGRTRSTLGGDELPIPDDDDDGSSSFALDEAIDLNKPMVFRGDPAPFDDWEEDDGGGY